MESGHRYLHRYRGPSTAICVEELHKCGADTFIRVGTCASTCADVQCGDIVVVSGSVRMDGTSLHYLPMEFPAVPSYQLLKALEESSVSLGFHTTVGVSITKDSFTRRRSRRRSRCPMI